MLLSIVARSMSMEALLFFVFLTALVVFLNIPLQNLLNKLFEGHKKTAAVIEIGALLLLAYLLTRWAEPTVSQMLQVAVDAIVETIIRIFK